MCQYITESIWHLQFNVVFIENVTVAVVLQFILLELLEKV